ncbi:cytochrome c oxidase subunit II [Haloarchaeobius sp. HRN-SO-5]|uniref:cytochrome c oxidase subunit II n=1 Tax=Haloarchaeobius sp. HRN-SO-5 TaxID=3446118 RepID=UPI003EC07A56
MHIHKYEKLWLVASLLLIVGFIATVTYGAVGLGIQMVDDIGGTVDPQNLDNHSEFSDPGVRKTGPNEYEVYVVTRQFLFEPGTNQPIRVPSNSEVTFHITSADVIHGFEVAGTNANTMAIPGQVATITVEFDEPGTYGLVCNEYCGGGHHVMEGKLVVVPEDEYTYNGSDSS